MCAVLDNMVPYFYFLDVILLASTDFRLVHVSITTARPQLAQADFGCAITATVEVLAAHLQQRPQTTQSPAGNAAG